MPPVHSTLANGLLSSLRLGASRNGNRQLLHLDIPRVSNVGKRQIANISSRSNHAHSSNKFLSHRIQPKQTFRLPRSSRRNYSDPPSSKPSPNPTPNLGSPPPQPSPSLSERLRKLSREYGWAATGVYFGLSLLDFPFCFLAVRSLGTERIGHLEHVVVSNAKRLFRIPLESAGVIEPQAESEAEGETEKRATANKDGGGFPEDKNTPQEVGWGVEEAQKNYDDSASLGTQLALAYAIHKSFIFLRIPLTAAVTPRVVKTLRGWGWNIGKRKPKVESGASSSKS